MLTWTIRPLELELRYTWKISRNASDKKTNLVVTAADGTFTGEGEAAPNIRYQESAEEGLAQFDRIKQALTQVNEIASLQELLRGSGIFNSLRFAIESAFIHYTAIREEKSVNRVLDIPLASSVPVSYTIPIMDPAEMKNFYTGNRLERFPFIKLKIERESGEDALRYLAKFCHRPIMVDANESFTDVDECVRWMEKVKSIPLVFLEQPLPASMTDESAYLRKNSRYPLFADESVTDQADFSILQKSFDGINVKLMKAGGYLNGIRLLKEARKSGMKTMTGCMVETTLGISCGYRISSLADYADLDSFLLLKDEPYQYVREESGVLYPTADFV